MITPFKENLCSRFATKMISVKITSVCNAKCTFCIDHGGYCPNETCNVDDLAEKINGLTEYRKVIITGGEPSFFLDKRVIPLMKKIRPFKDHIALNTNGMLFTVPGATEKLNGLLDELQISIHAPDEKLNKSVFGVDTIPGFKQIAAGLKGHLFTVSINSNFNHLGLQYEKDVNKNFVKDMAILAKQLDANKLRLTELKHVPDDVYVPMSMFKIPYDYKDYTDDELVTKGCTTYVKDGNLLVSMKRVCKYAKGKDAKAFSCCFVDRNGQDKIKGIEHVDSTFKVVYYDGTVTSDWIF